MQAMYRELHEEVGLKPEHVKVIGRTRDWLRYEVPDKFIKREVRGHYRGQKQIWFLLRMVGRDCDICLRATDHPEFDAWRWNHYWVPLDAVIEFKRDVYQLALTELSRFLRRAIPRQDEPCGESAVVGDNAVPSGAIGSAGSPGPADTTAPTATVEGCQDAEVQIADDSCDAPDAPDVPDIHSAEVK